MDFFSGFSVIPAINAFGFSHAKPIKWVWPSSSCLEPLVAFMPPLLKTKQKVDYTVLFSVQEMLIMARTKTLQRPYLKGMKPLLVTLKASKIPLRA